MKKLTALLIAVVMIVALIPAALGADYDYPLKSLYDTNFWYRQDPKTPNPTLGHVVQFLSTNTRKPASDGRYFPYQVDLDKFINSALGEKTASIWEPHMKYEDQMDEGLLKYWADMGLQKIQKLNADNGDAINTDYYVYLPTKVEAPAEGYPLVVLYHGGGEVAYQAETFGFCELAAREGIVLAMTENTGDKASTKGIISAMIDEYNIDDSRVYIVGSSGGGSNAMSFSVENMDMLAGVGIMDQPVSLSTRWYRTSDDVIAHMSEYTRPMVWVGGTADMYGLHGVWGLNPDGESSTEFFEKNEGNEIQFISGWNNVMKAFNIKGHDIESRLTHANDEDANYALRNDGYPFDNVVDIDPTGTSPIYKCTMNDSDDVTLFLVENRAHMPSGFDAENIWSVLSGYRRNFETGMAEPVGASVSGNVVKAEAADETAAVDFTYNGEEAIASVRAKLNTELPILDVTSEYDFEYNEKEAYIVVYTDGAFESGTKLFTVELDVSDALPGTYNVGIDIVQATDTTPALIDLTGAAGKVIVKAMKGDVDQDGDIDNADLIMIARYLVELEQFSAAQKEIADYNDDGAIDNIDLVLIARVIAA